MKSIALSLLVAVGLTLGAANAFAETSGPGAVPNLVQQANLEAEQHARRAAELRAIARIEAQKARDSMKIALDDEKLGFTYEAGVQRAKAAQHQQAAATALRSAEREDQLAAMCRAKAQAAAAAQSSKAGTFVVSNAPRPTTR